MKKALITGITGQDGSYLAELLLAKGYEVYGVVRRASTINTGRIDHIFDPEDRQFLRFGDLADGIDDILYSIQPDEIYNMASMSHVKVSFDIPVYTADVTAIGPLRILEGMRKLNLKHTRFYQASSCLPAGTKVLARKVIQRVRYGKTEEFETMVARNIEDLKVDDVVLSMDLQTSKKEYCKVEATDSRFAEKMYCLGFSNGNSLELSDNHPVYVLEQGWVRADELKIGDRVIQKRYPGFAGSRLRRDKINTEIYGEERGAQINHKCSIAQKKLGKKGSYVERYGEAKAEKIKQKLRGSNPKKAHVSWNTGLSIETSSKLKVVGKNISKAHKKLWADHEHVKKMTKAFGFTKNVAELQLESLLTKLCLGEFLYNGSGEVMILGRKIPDFVNINGKKKVIEFYGSHWHTKEEEQERVKLFKTLGWETLVIWEIEFKNIQQLESKIETFVYNPGIDIIEITHIKKIEPAKVYDIQVAKNHNFFAYGILVHNSEMFGTSPPPQNENTPFNPVSPYGISKLFGYNITRAYRTGYNMFACSGILFNHESERRGETFVTRKVTKAAVRIKLGLQDKLTLGNLETMRDWGHSKDYCLVGDSKVLVENPKDSYHRMGVKPIKDIKIGDRVLTFNEKASSKEFENVVNVMKRTSEDVVKVTFSNNNYLMITKNHPIAIIREGQIHWTPVESIQVGDKVIQKKHCSVTKRVFNLTNNVAYDQRYNKEKSIQIRNKIGVFRRGKTYGELYGDRAEDIISQRSETVKYNYKNNPDLREKRKQLSTGINNGNYKYGNTLKNAYCKDCGQLSSSLSFYYEIDRCRICGYVKKVCVIVYCEDCGKYLGESAGKCCKSCARKRTWQDPNFKIDFIKKMHQRWQDPIYRDKTIKSIIQGNKKKGPNKPEKYLSSILEEICPGEFKYTGAGEIIINGKNPDFVNINGKKKIIELFGDYWHRGEDPQDRIDIFTPYGYDTLVVWENELKNLSRLKESITTFLFNPDIEIVSITAIERQKQSYQVHNIETEKNHNYFAHGILVHNCNCIHKIMQHDRPDDFVVATGYYYTIRDFVREVFEYLDMDWMDYVDYDEALVRPNEVPALQGLATKAKEVLGWEPKIDFQQLVRMMVDSDYKEAKKEVINRDAERNL